MNIVITTPIFPPDIGGPATYSCELLKRLSRRQHQVRVATLSPLAGGSNVHVIQRKRLRFPALLFTYLVSFIRLLRITKGCDIIYTQTPSLLGLASLLVARLRRRPIVLRFVGDRAWEMAFNSQKTDKFLENFLLSPEGGIQIKMMLYLQRFVLNKVNRIIVPAQFLKEILVDNYGVNPEKVKVIHNSIDMRDYKVPRSEISPISGATKLITIGRLISHKRINRLLSVMKEIIKKYPDVTLKIVGGGPEKGDLQTLSQRLDIAGQVEFHGQLSHQETIALLSQADIFILNSVYEGFPHTVIEAMACRVPVIASNTRGTNEVIEDNETGLLVAVDNDAHLKEKITIVLRDRELRERLVDNAYQSVIENFTWEKNLTVLEKELEAVSGK